jgi:hypothetical protein
VKKTSSGSQYVPPGIVPDDRYPGMYRIRIPGGGLSDMVNLTRAKDALAEIYRKRNLSNSRRVSACRVRVSSQRLRIT